jgi:hypothetical protein
MSSNTIVDDSTPLITFEDSHIDSKLPELIDDNIDEVDYSTQQFDVPALVDDSDSDDSDSDDSDSDSSDSDESSDGWSDSDDDVNDRVRNSNIMWVQPTNEKDLVDIVDIVENENTNIEPERVHELLEKVSEGVVALDTNTPQYEVDQKLNQQWIHQMDNEELNVLIKLMEGEDCNDVNPELMQRVMTVASEGRQQENHPDEDSDDEDTPEAEHVYVGEGPERLLVATGDLRRRVNNVINQDSEINEVKPEEVRVDVNESVHVQASAGVQEEPASGSSYCAIM